MLLTFLNFSTTSALCVRLLLYIFYKVVTINLVILVLLLLLFLPLMHRLQFLERTNPATDWVASTWLGFQKVCEAISSVATETTRSMLEYVATNHPRSEYVQVRQLEAEVSKSNIQKANRERLHHVYGKSTVVYLCSDFFMSWFPFFLISCLWSS